MQPTGTQTSAANPVNVGLPGVGSTKGDSLITKVVALILMIGALVDTVALDVLVAMDKFVTIFPSRPRRGGKKPAASDGATEQRRDGKKRGREKNKLSERPIAAGAPTSA
jgi:hypothetical protein